MSSYYVLSKQQQNWNPVQVPYPLSNDVVRVLTPSLLILHPINVSAVSITDVCPLASILIVHPVTAPIDQPSPRLIRIVIRGINNMQCVVC
jgi:hypothetical protein